MSQKNSELKGMPVLCALSGLAIGLTTIISSTRCFGAERIVFWRESSSGLNRVAYFLGEPPVNLPVDQARTHARTEEERRLFLTEVVALGR
eukprot:COSAG01_NODE_3852_length_5629_cov_3.080108_8_plen_91_part_00